MSKYDTLLRILDQIRNEAESTKYKSIYLPVRGSEEKLNAARSRAYVHLFLKVFFGITRFEEREVLVTDGTQDGGIDGYFIDTAGLFTLTKQGRRNTL